MASSIEPVHVQVRASSGVESVVLLDEHGHAIGAAAKATVHHADTPLHLAFSCHIFDDDGRVLVTRRAASKRSFPGIWTNSCCGHPAPGEGLRDAVHRRVSQELGLQIVDLRLILPRFRYRAEQDGIVEYEMCPVFAATVADAAALNPDPSEVDDAVWEPWDEFRSQVLSGERTVSKWCREQLESLPADPGSTPAASASDLPPAASL